MADDAVRILKNSEAVARAAAEVFVGLAPRPGDQRACSVALAGGATPRALYGLLASPQYRHRVEWSRVFFFFGDERSVQPDHPDSNYRMARETLFGPLEVPETNIHRMKAEWPDLEAAAADYEKVLQAAFTGTDFPRFDLILLGMGPDGHTASLFPGRPVLAERTRWVAPVWDAPKPPPRRLTLTLPVLNAARLVLFMVTGADKAAALRAVLDGTSQSGQYPAGLVQPGAQRLIWLADGAAAGSLSRSGHA